MRSDENSLVELPEKVPMCLRNQWILVDLDSAGAPIFNTIVSFLLGLNAVILVFGTAVLVT